MTKLELPCLCIEKSDELGEEEIEEFHITQPTTSSTIYEANRVLEEIRGLGNKVVNYVEQPVIDEGAEEETLMQDEPICYGEEEQSEDLPQSFSEMSEMISDYVKDLLETLEVSQGQTIEPIGNIKTIETLKKPEELMV